jgi:hypothetical protein
MRCRLLLGGSAALAASLICLAFAQPAAMAAAGQPARPTGPSLQPWPITITIRTVPALRGVRFAFDGRRLTTGRRGQVSQTERHNFSLHTLRLLRTRFATRNRRYSFVRWAGQRDPNQAFSPRVRGLPMRANYTVTASFAVQCPVLPFFTDQHGSALDPGRIALVSLRSDTGQPASLSPSGTTWLPCARTIYRGSTLSSRPVRYSVQSVMILGANVVHAGVERFWPDRTPDPTVVGYFHDLTIAAHDALFGSGTGTIALVTLPDNSLRRVPLGAGHAATLSNLPQGRYRVEVKAGSAIISAQSLRLSKDQTVNFTAVTMWDLATVGGAVLLIAAGLPLLSGSRRKRVLGLLARHRRQAASA